MNTTENNKLIAEFMGLELKDKTYFIANSELKPVMGIIGKTSNELLFHCSWNWLMPVIDKIDEVLPENILFKIEYNRAFVEDIENYNQVIDVFANSRIEATYKAVVEFIKWYNENK